MRKMVKRERSDVVDLYSLEGPLFEIVARLNTLSQKYGAAATISISAGDPDVVLQYWEPETEQERAARLKRSKIEREKRKEGSAKRKELELKELERLAKKHGFVVHQEEEK